MSEIVNPLTGEIIEPKTQVAFWARPLRVAAVIMSLNAGVLILITLLFMSATGDWTIYPEDFITPLFVGFFALMLWQERGRWGSFVFWIAILGLLLAGGSALASGDWIGLISQLSYSGALILVLGSTPSASKSRFAFWLNLIGNVTLTLLFVLSIVYG